MYKFESWGGRRDSKPSLNIPEQDPSSCDTESRIKFDNSQHFVSKTASASGGTVIFTANFSPKKGF